MLELRGVTAGYGTATVLRSIDLAVPDGAVVALLGPNGAGKTTLLRVASGLLVPSAGSVVVDGEDATSEPPHSFAGRGVCHVPEGRGIWRSLSVGDNLRLHAHPGQEAEALDRAVQAFPKLGTRLTQVAGTLSGGEQQMLAIARAYVSDPSVVLLDEVSMGLAPLIIDEIFEFLGRVASDGTALLIVEQYVDRALALAQYLYLLDRGRVTFAGEPSEVSADDLAERYLSGGKRAASRTPAGEPTLTGTAIVPRPTRAPARRRPPLRRTTGGWARQ
jgi:branched-chain amino acid transport system ATP-binding protein